MDYKQIISDLNRDLDVISLVEKYEIPSLWDAMGVGRREMSHSSFIGEILKENSLHDLGTLPLQWFLDLLLDKANAQDKKKADDDEDWSGKLVAIPEELQQAILTHNLHPSNIKVECEKTIPGGRVDLVVDFDIEAIKISDRRSAKHITIVIENKINSKEHDDQTSTYYKYFESLKGYKAQENEKKGLHPLERFILYVYLTPEPTKNLRDAYILPFCNQKNFIQINYQNILDHIISPALALTACNSRHYLCLSEYKKALGISFNDMETKGKKVKKAKLQCVVMAVDKDSATELYSFWKKYGTLLSAAENVKCGNYQIEGGKKRQLYLWNGNVYDRTHLVNAMLCSYAESHTFDEVIETFGILKHKKDGNDVIKRIRDDCSESYYYKEKGNEIVTRDDVHCYSLRQWPKAAFSTFRNLAENIGYSIEDHEADTISREEYNLLLAFYNKHHKLIAATKAILEYSGLVKKETRPLPF